MKTETLIELQSRIHNQNVAMGWHDEPRSLNTFVCLFHSELSEAMEGLRKNLMDDHLTQYPMFQVELADFVIRCFDYLGLQSFNGWNETIKEYNDDASEPWSSGCKSEIDLLAELHSLVSTSHVAASDKDISNSLIAGCVIGAYSFSFEHNFDLKQVIDEKVEYNKLRADHKRENRAKSNGKKF